MNLTFDFDGVCAVTPQSESQQVRYICDLDKNIIWGEVKGIKQNEALKDFLGIFKSILLFFT